MDQTKGGMMPEARVRDSLCLECLLGLLLGFGQRSSIRRNQGADGVKLVPLDRERHRVLKLHEDPKRLVIQLAQPMADHEPPKVEPRVGADITELTLLARADRKASIALSTSPSWM